MATNMFKKYSENLVREIDVPSGTLSGAAVLEPISLRPAVTLTARGDAVKTATFADGGTYTGVAGSGGGIGNKPTGAAAAFDGSWIFPVTGVTAGGTETGAAGTDKGTAVYAVVASGVITSLTLTVGSNTFFGRIDDGTCKAGIAPVQIGIV